jgi:aminoglycoside phosphotransferase family enzyme/predicted kinase
MSATISAPTRTRSDLSGRMVELLRPAAFPHPAPDPRLIETHISWVILAGEFVYKLRKPVDFGFLDFSTVEQRRADCEAEVRLNRRLCPDLYLGVVDVVERDGLLAITSPGVPIEPAVLMRRLPEAGMLTALLERGAADDRLMERLARQLADFHAEAATGIGVDEHGSLAGLRANWAENFAQTKAFIGRTITAPQYAEIAPYVEHFIETNAQILVQRVEQGRIRDGHGVLHAGSVCVARRRLYLFDCIEFNDRFRCTDVAAEVAFLAMDLDHLGRADLGFAFVDAYVRRSGDRDVLALLDFYKCYRAFVRGKVLSFQLDEPERAASELDHALAAARAYFDLACAYARQAEPTLLVTMGLPASGKTTLAHALAGRLGLVHLSSDVVRKQLAGVRPSEHRLDGFERGLYGRSMSRRTYAMLRKQAARWLRRGRSLVLDATYSQPGERAALRQLARRTGARLLVIVCRADESVMLARLAARLHDPSTVSDARPELWPALKAAFVEPDDMSEALSVDTMQPLELTIDQVLQALHSGGTRSLDHAQPRQ